MINPEKYFCERITDIKYKGEKGLILLISNLIKTYNYKKGFIFYTRLYWSCKNVNLSIRHFKEKGQKVAYSFSTGGILINC